MSTQHTLPNADRQTGRTTSQMKSAPHNAVFVWITHDLHYPKRLCQELGRNDLKIVGPGWLENGWRGMELSGLVIDHAAVDHMTPHQRRSIFEARARVRQPMTIAKATGGEQ